MELYPEIKYFRNSIVIGDLPINVDLHKLFSHFDDISFWKSNGRKIIPDFKNPNQKAVILTYNDEETACASVLHFKAVSKINFIIYDGMALFCYCKQLDVNCDFRSRNVLLSGVDLDKSREVYFDIFKEFGHINYIKICPDGEISKVRVEFKRATSAYAAVLSLEVTMNQQSVISLEMSLFPISPIGRISNDTTAEMPLFPICPIGHINNNIIADLVKEPTLNTNHINEDIKQAFWCYTMNMNVYQNQHTFTKHNGIHENTTCHRELMEEYMMEGISFGITRRSFKEKLNFPYVVPKYVKDYLDRGGPENLKRFLQSTKKMLSFHNIWC